MPQGPQVITFGNIQSSFILTVSITPAPTAGTTTLEQTFTVPGLQVGDILTMSPQFAITTLVTLENARVSAANTLAIAFNNSTGGSLTYPSGTYAIEVNRPYPGLSMSGIQ
jgi:hypothetical protein